MLHQPLQAVRGDNPGWKGNGRIDGRQCFPMMEQIIRVVVGIVVGIVVG